MPVRVAGLRRESRDDHIGPKRPNNAHHIREDFLMAPSVQRILEIFRITEVDGSREELLRPVNAAGRQKLRLSDLMPEPAQ